MFKKLFSPLQIGPVTIKNRIQVTPHEQQFLADGLVTETMVDYYAERARGGVGLLEVSRIDVKAANGIGQPEWKFDSARRFPLVSGPEIVSGLRSLTETVHRYDSRIFMEVAAWTFLYGPVSSLPFENGMNLRELTGSDIEEIQEAHAQAAGYVRDAGFDGLDLHGTHGTLLEQFYSPATNRRSDRYGGNFENRLRFLTELIEVVRGKISNGMALGMRLCADEKIEGGVTPDYAARMVQMLDDKLDFINVDSGAWDHYEASDQAAYQSAPLYLEPGYGVYMAEAAKKAANKTKIGIAGRIIDPALADSILVKDQADYVGMTRALIADPELPKKAFEGRLEDIRPCIGTLQYCWGRAVMHEWPLRCTVNPMVGREKQGAELKAASKRKRILIIGAGPAGLEAARVASQRGHEVVVYEKSPQIGGQVNFAKKLPGRSDIGAIIGWYGVQLRKNHVRLELGKEVGSRNQADMVVKQENPDVVILASGSNPIRTGIQMVTCREVPGWENENVQVIDDVLSSDEDEGGEVVVADSTTYVEGPGIAEWLSSKGGRVTLITPHPHIAPELTNYNQRIQLIRRLDKANVKIITLSWLKSIAKRSVTLYNIPTGKTVEVTADRIILNTGRQQRELKEYFHDLGEVYEVGDCKIAGGRIDGAISTGWEVASTV